MSIVKNQQIPGKEYLTHFTPNLWSRLSVSKIMYIVLLALLLPTAASIYFFGYHALSVISVSIGTALLTEYIAKKLRHRIFVMDGSAVITGLLLAFSLPPTIPLWAVALGSFFSIAIVKEIFGGLGHNIFNPAMGGRAFMTVSFPSEMTTWIAPSGFSPDAVTSASPLSDSFEKIGSNLDLYWDLFIGNISGSLGETSALLILISGLLLIALRVISWSIPTAFIGTVILFSFALGQDPIFNILSGGLILGAFFIATDPVTCPITNTGRLIFGIGAGILTIAIRSFAYMPEGVCFSILIMNAVSPLIDRYIILKPHKLKKVLSE